MEPRLALHFQSGTNNCFTKNSNSLSKWSQEWQYAFKMEAKVVMGFQPPHIEEVSIQK